MLPPTLDKLINLLCKGAVFSRPDEKHAQSKLTVTQAQKLEYAYN